MSEEQTINEVQYIIGYQIEDISKREAGIKSVEVVAKAKGGKDILLHFHSGKTYKVSIEIKDYLTINI
jgi:hypothetical protein